jgi:hypothetical protein
MAGRIAERERLGQRGDGVGDEKQFRHSRGGGNPDWLAVRLEPKR